MRALGINNSQILITTQSRHGGYLKFLTLQLGREVMNLKIAYASADIQHCLLEGNKQINKNNEILETWIYQSINCIYLEQVI